MSRPGESLFAIRARAYTAGKLDARRELAREVRRYHNDARLYWSEQASAAESAADKDRCLLRAREHADHIETLSKIMRATRGR